MGVRTAAGEGETLGGLVCLSLWLFFFPQLLVCLDVSQPACPSDPLLAFSCPSVLCPSPLYQPWGCKLQPSALPVIFIARVANVLPGQTVTPMLVIQRGGSENRGVSGRKVLSLLEGQGGPCGWCWPVAAPSFSPLPFCVFPSGAPILKTKLQPSLGYPPQLPTIIVFFTCADVDLPQSLLWCPVDPVAPGDAVTDTCPSPLSLSTPGLPFPLWLLEAPWPSSPGLGSIPSTVSLPSSLGPLAQLAS